jgi:large subunit ribosomal protein L31e
MSTKKTATKTKTKAKTKAEAKTKTATKAKAKAETKAEAKAKTKVKGKPRKAEEPQEKPEAVEEKPEEIKEPEEAAEKEEEAEKPKEPEKKKLVKKEEAEDIVEERVYTIPLGRVWITPRKKRSPKAIRVLRAFVMKHMKVEEGSVRITSDINEKVWSKGIEKPPRRIRVRVTKDSEGIVTVRPVEGT